MRELLVADASPLIALARIERLQLLPQIFARIETTETVWAECLANPSAQERIQLNHALNLGWVERVVNPPPAHDWRLGPGETSAITLALERHAAVMIDERAARRTAARLGLPVIGTIGVLVLAKRHGFIASIRADIYHLADTGYRLSPALLTQALQQVGETP